MFEKFKFQIGQFQYLLLFFFELCINNPLLCKFDQIMINTHKKTSQF